MTDDMVLVDDLRIRRPRFEIGDVSFTIPRGSVVGLVGPNGAGKTTIIRSLVGLVRPDAGRIEVMDRPAGSADALARIGVVLDQPTAAPEWRVDSLGRRLAPFHPAWDQRLLVDMLDRLAVPGGRAVGELSRGQGVKLALALALAQQPELLILDEPSSGLDPAARREIGDLIREFMIEPSRAVLLSTHITTDLHDLADELIVVVGGRVAHRGALPSVLDEFAVVRGAGPSPEGPVVGLQRTGEQWSGLIRMHDSAAFGPEVVLDPASIDDIVIHLGAEHEAVAA